MGAHAVIRAFSSKLRRRRGGHAAGCGTLLSSSLLPQEMMHCHPVTVFCRSLAQLSAMLDKTGTAPPLLAARLHPDMLPFA